MDKNYILAREPEYSSPEIEILNIAAEEGFQASYGEDGAPGQDPFEHDFGGF